MGRQIRFYMMDAHSVQRLAETFMQNGFEVMLYQLVQNDDGTTSPTYQPTRIDDSVLEQTQYLLGPHRFRKPEYGKFISYSESPYIEWIRRPTEPCNGMLPASRIYINTQYSDGWEPGVLELLLKDYKALMKVVNKLTPRTSVDRNGTIVRARMDTVTVEYVKKGYRLWI